MYIYLSTVFNSFEYIARSGIAGSYLSLYLLVVVLTDCFPFCVLTSNDLLSFCRPQKNWRMFLTWKRIMRSTVTPAFRLKAKLTGYVTALGKELLLCPLLVHAGSPSQEGLVDLVLVLESTGRRVSELSMKGIVSYILRAHRETISGQVVHHLIPLLIFIAVMGISK